MQKLILLLGAGFSKNWGGPLASEVTNLSRLQSDPSLRNLLHNTNFEDALAELQKDYLLLAKGRLNTLQERRLTEFQTALSALFEEMNMRFQSRQFEFSNEIAKSFGKFLTSFDAIFTLNQDLLIELNYSNQNVALWHQTRWQGWEMPGLRALPVTDHNNPATNKWRPQPSPFQSNERMQPYYKLHGSSGWVADDGQRLLVIGRDKTGTIAQHPILSWSYQQFENYLHRDHTRLMVIGYGFGDEHINQSLIDAHQAGKLEIMYLVQPSGKAVMNKFPPGSIPGPQPLLTIPCVECTARLSNAFNDDDVARDLMEGIFG